MCAGVGFVDGIDFVTPDLIQELAPLVLAHRLGIRAEGRFAGVSAATLVSDILESIDVPR